MNVDPAEHLPLALFLAKKYGRDVREPEAVIEAAFFALLTASRGFDPKKGTWAGYAAASVAMAVRGEVMRQFREQRPEPLYRVTEAGEEIERSDLPHEEPHDGAGLMAARVRELVADLDPREAEVIRRRFGLDGPEETLAAVGLSLGISRGRAAQLERKALGKLRRALSRRSR